MSEDAVTKNQAVTDAFLSADGVYQVIPREHVGDTRGEDWYTNLIVVASILPAGRLLRLFSRTHRTEGAMDSTATILTRIDSPRRLQTAA